MPSFPLNTYVKFGTAPANRVTEGQAVHALRRLGYTLDAKASDISRHRNKGGGRTIVTYWRKPGAASAKVTTIEQTR